MRTATFGLLTPLHVLQNCTQIQEQSLFTARKVGVQKRLEPFGPMSFRSALLDYCTSLSTSCVCTAPLMIIDAS